jgi:LuxR family maltose regulon positive regulatory protein
VDLAEPENWTRFIADAAPTLGDVVAELATRRPGSGYVRALLRAHGVANAATSPTAMRAAATPGAAATGSVAPDSTSPQALLDPLSDRELEVLRLLASDLDGPAIARHLIVSLNTVRTHTKRIYTKLGVNNRRAAVTRAHQLGLITRTARP